MKKVRLGLLLLAAIAMLSVPVGASANGLIEKTAPPVEFVPASAAPQESEPGTGEDAPASEWPQMTQEPSSTVIVTVPAPSGGAGAPAKVEPEADGGTITAVVCAACAVVAVAAVLGAVLVLRKGGRGRTKASGACIPLRLEVYSGRCRNKSADLKLSDCLTIGSSSDCDIIFDNPEVAPKASCIRLVDGQLYIEDLNSPQGVALDGIRFQGRNRLRSGEVISIGSVEFAVFSDDPGFGTPI